MILGGVELKHFFAPGTFVAKVIGLTIARGSGLFVGLFCVSLRSEGRGFSH